MSRDPIADADSRERQNAKDEARRRLQQEQDAADLRWLMSHPQGHRFIARLLEETAVHRTAFHTSGQVMAMNEGRKMIGYWLVGELTEHAPDAYFDLLRNYANRD